MTCSDSLNQLLVLLWKSWKTLIRSKGWLASQIIITVVTLAFIVYFMHSEKSRTSRMGNMMIKEENNEKRDAIHDLYYKCIDNLGVSIDCSKEITNAMTKICTNQHKELGLAIGTTPEFCARKEHNDTNLLIRELSDKSIDADFFAQGQPHSSAAGQFKEPTAQERKEGYYEGPEYFRPLAVFSGGMDKMTVQWLKPISSKAVVDDEHSSAILVICAIPVLLFCVQVTLEVAQEATSLIKDYLLSVGMSRTLYFAHHLIFHFLKTWPVVLSNSIILGWFFDSIGFALYMLLVTSLSLSAWISFSMLIGTVLKKPGFAAFTTMNLLIVMALLPLKLANISRTNRFKCILSCLIPNQAISLILDAKFEAGLRGENIWFSEINEAVPQGFLLLMLALDTLLFFMLAIEIDKRRSSFENPLSLLFRKSKSQLDEEKSIGENRETSDRQTKPDLVLEGVHKMYSTGEHAVRGVNMRMYKGQVTALLGHNGAGKSTTFSMISGMTVPTKGRIQIGDDESKEGRQNLIGFCPQYNAIFPKLTVDEHLHFFAKLKGVNSTNGDIVLGALGMGDKGNSWAAHLSGGMKRKLCIAIAFAADSPIILLDEPTAGMDTGARRDFERLLLERKKDHTILLTTHYTDEAEMLADKIIIMARGKVFCSGSAQFLRKKFDSGFILSFAVEKESDTDKALDEMMKIATEFIPNVSVYKKRSKQFEFKLVTDNTSSFCDMFRKIETTGKTVFLQSYGLSMNKLEQVFLKVGELTGTHDRSAEVETAMKDLIQENDRRAEGAGKASAQVGNTLMKRIYYEQYHIPSLLYNIVMLFLMTYYVFSSMIGNGNASKSSEAVSLLNIGLSYRIGIDASLHGQFDQIKRISSQFGDRFTIEESSSIVDWYTKTGNNRPPILGGLSKAGKDWTVFAHPRNKLYLPTLEAIAATVNNPSLKVKFDFRKEVKKEPRKEHAKPAGSNQTQIVMFLVVLPMLISIMIFRPAAFLIAERVSNFGHQQRLTGASRLALVLSGILYDFCLFLVYFVFFLGAAYAGARSFTRENLAILICMPLVGFLSGDLVVILLSRRFNTPAMGQNMICLLMFMEAMVLAVVTALGGAGGTYLSALISPMFAVSGYARDSLGAPSAIGLGIAHFIMLITIFSFVQFELGSKWKRRGSKQQPNEEEGKPPADNLVLRVENLQKTYEKGTIHAVKGITFGVRAHECFGVLGINGAGKTSTYEILTGNTLPTEGTATVGGVDCSTPATIGYCPQADALIEDLTGRQSLIVLAALHGYDNPRCVADVVITCVGMDEHCDKQSKRYSGGQRRKISVAASLLAQNSLIILDEPTAGIDPIARRDIWSVICALRESTNTAIVLTSHSMDEVEALVSNLIILREGSIVVEGSPQMIKNQYGDHYNFNLVIDKVTDVGQRSERATSGAFRELVSSVVWRSGIEITGKVVNGFPTATLYDSASLRNIKYSIPRSRSDVFSEIFEKASAIAKELNAADFSFTQATLEDAFLLAATAKADTEPIPPSPVVVASNKDNKTETKGTETKTGTGTQSSPVKTA